jgi:hypothetical protein
MGTENNRKVGIYRGGDFSMAPLVEAVGGYAASLTGAGRSEVARAGSGATVPRRSSLRQPWRAPRAADTIDQRLTA